MAKAKKIVKNSKQSNVKTAVKAITKSAPIKKAAPEKDTTKNNGALNLVYRLREVMDISFASTFQAELTQVFTKKINSFSFDASKVQRLTTPCVQIIISVSRTCADKDLKFLIKNPSEITQKVFNDLGLNNQLNEWSL